MNKRRHPLFHPLPCSETDSLKFVAGDVTEEATVAALLETTRAHFGGWLDALVLNAG